MRDHHHCKGPKRSAAPNRTKITLEVFDDTQLDKEVDVVLVSDDDVTVTLPYQPLAGTTVLISTKAKGTVVQPGCLHGCHCDDKDEDSDCDKFCVVDEAAHPVDEVEIPKCSQQLFTYFPADADECGHCGPGTWVFGFGIAASGAT
jgi:hypothetical protein